MPLQKQNLVMVGLGTLGDTPSNFIQPKLTDGIHLRWAFARERGFPSHGFYLFRRIHRTANPACLSKGTINFQAGPLSVSTLNIPTIGRITSDKNFLLTDDFDPSGTIEFDLDGRSYLRLVFLPDESAHSVEVQIRFRNDSKIVVTAKLADTVVDQTTVSGVAGDTGKATLKFDAITEITFSSGPAALVELCYFPILRDAAGGWNPIEEFSYPMCLPVTHPDYPCTPGMSENLSEARELARGRIRYGEPDQFTSPPVPIHSDGTVSIVNGSSIVTGTATNWNKKLIGAVLQISGDPTAYIITAVVSPTKLVLSRNYTEASKTAAGYAINQDTYGQLHDYLVHLVRGDITAEPMANRFLPVPVYSEGKAIVVQGHATVKGIGTNWTEDLAGLAMQFTELSVGNIGVSEGSSSVTGVGTVWNSGLVGRALRISGESRHYTITNIASPTQLTLDSIYVGSSDSNKDYSIFDPTPYTITSVESPTELTLNQGYLRDAEFGVEKTYNIISALEAIEPDKVAPRMSTQYPLDLVLLGTLHPAIAQMVGLYWVDEEAAPGQAFDYLILADYDGNLEGLEPREILRKVKQTGFDDLDGFIVFDKKAAPQTPLAGPVGLRVYALPGGSHPGKNGDLQNASNNAGLNWELGVTEQKRLLPDRPIMYHLWRADLGSDEPTNAPPVDQFELVTADRPILITRPQLPLDKEPQRPP